MNPASQFLYSRLLPIPFSDLLLYYGEGPDAGQAGHWWLARILKYTAHPETLPIDGHGGRASHLLALWWTVSVSMIVEL